MTKHNRITAAHSPAFPATRLRRLRGHQGIRNLIRETELHVNDFILPLFIHETLSENKPIATMPGQYQLSLQHLDQEIAEIVALGIPAVLLFGIPEHKDGHGSQSYRDDGVIQRAIRQIKNKAPELLVIADCCLCEYTEHGHCGTVSKHGADYTINNDETLEILTQQSISYAKAGADMIAPSGMMDGAIVAIRQGLDQESYHQIPLMSYAAKYASSNYGPFRDAAEGAPQFGDRRSYQMDPANANEALREISLDINEGADIIIIKPALNYLDVICRAKQQFPQIPLAAYQVSGEYSMIKAAAELGWLNEQQVMMESLTAIKRAGANMIISYFAKEAVRLLT